jgi:hypothetical protein
MSLVYSATSPAYFSPNPYLSATSIDMSDAGNAYLTLGVPNKKYTVEVTSADGSVVKKEVPQAYFPMALGATVYTPGLPTLPYSLDLNNDPDIHRRVVKHFMYKTLDDWLQKGGPMYDIIKKCKIVGNKVSFGKEQTNVSQDVFNRLIIYFEDNVVTYDFVKKILKTIVKETDVTWVNLFKKEHEGLIKELLKKSIMIKMRGSS